MKIEDAKVGMSVRVYSLTGDMKPFSYVGKIRLVMANEQQVRVCSGDDTDGQIEWIHSCRKLKKKTRREWWVSPLIASANGLTCACKNETKPDRCKESVCIRVREIKNI